MDVYVGKARPSKACLDQIRELIEKFQFIKVAKTDENVWNDV